MIHSLLLGVFFAFWWSAARARDSAERKLIIADLIAFGQSRSRDIASVARALA